MAINIQYPTQLVTTVGVIESEMDGTPGYMLNIDQKYQFITKDDADAIARYILFGEDPENPE